MSYVTNVIIATHLYEEDLLVFHNALNKLVILNNREARKGFLYVPRNKVGGTKSLEADLFIAAFNYLILNEFIDFIKSLPEKLPDIDLTDLQVLIKKDDSDKWEVFDLENIDNL